MNQSIENNKVNNTEPVYDLGTASKLSEISVHSIRQYIDNNLIIPRVTNLKQHLFSQIDIERLKCIKKTTIQNRIKYCRDKGHVFINPILVNSS